MAALETMPTLADCAHEAVPAWQDVALESVALMPGRRLRELRLQAGWRNGTLARYLGVQPCTYSAFEMGRTVPSPHMLHVLTETLGCSVDQLYPKPSEVAA